MNKGDNIILVVGATGQQGRAVARRLIDTGWKVRILTRDLGQPAVQRLQQQGAEAVQGNVDDPVSLQEAMNEVYGVFSFQPQLSYEDELRQGKAMADAAKAAGVNQFVYSSVGGAEGQSAFRKIAKWDIEQYIKTLGVPFTILRPAGFMEEIISPRFGIPNGLFSIPIHPDVEIPLIAVEDIGVFVHLAFEHPEFLGKTVEIAGDSLLPSAIAGILSVSIGRPITYEQIPIDKVRQHNEIVARVYDFYNEAGYKVDIPALRQIHPHLLSLEAWLKKAGTAKISQLSN